MATFQESSDKLVVCPYKTTHIVKESRYQLHVANCAKENLDSHLATCPFNASHRPKIGEVDYHMLSCECRAVVDKQLIASNENSTHRGHVGVPSYHSEPVVETRENWDSEMTACGYSPSVEPPPGGIRTEFAGMKPAARRQYYASLHLRRDEEESQETIPKNSIPGLSKPETRSTKSAAASELEMPRAPRSVSFAQMLAQHKPDEEEFQNIGLGRGQPKRKLAANFSKPPIREQISVPQIPGFPNSNLGMGRGTSAVNSGSPHTGQKEDDDDDDGFILVKPRRGRRK